MKKVRKMKNNVCTDYFWEKLFPLLLTAGLTLFGWYKADGFAAKRDRANKQRDLRIEYLINSYSKLANASQRKPISGSQYFADMESAMADIQLFGTNSQVTKAKAMMDEFQRTGRGPLNELLRELRDDLRREMNLPEIDEDVQWFRPEGALMPLQTIKGN